MYKYNLYLFNPFLEFENKSDIKFFISVSPDIEKTFGFSILSPPLIE